jgi:hypothetical protein
MCQNNKPLIICLFLLAILTSSCKKDNDSGISIDWTFGFLSDSEAWTGGFADYPNEPGVDSIYGFEFSFAGLPAPLNTFDGALRQSGINRSDDLFMFVKRKINGLQADKYYDINIEIEIASNAPSGAVGAGGAPGESVFIKAGATTIEPTKVLDSTSNDYRMNIDKGNQMVDGNDMKLIGNFANGTDSATYQLKILKTENPIRVRSNANGEIWIIVGTDSGFEGKTTIFYNRISVNVKQSN